MKGPQRPTGMEPGVARRPDDVSLEDEREQRLELLKKRRESAMWTGVVGAALLFFGGLYWPLALGGAFMAISGGVRYFVNSVRIRRIDDPWRDEEIDAWEREHFDP